VASLLSARHFIPSPFRTEAFQTLDVSNPDPNPDPNPDHTPDSNTNT